MPTHPGPAGVNKMIAVNSRLEQAQHYAKDVQRGHCVATWHERDSQRMYNPESPTQHMAGDHTVSVPRVVPGGAEQTRIVAMQTAIQIAKASRTAQLKELLRRETAAYEDELQALGLALVKPHA